MRHLTVFENGKRVPGNVALQFQFDDGGREAAGFKGQTGDCATRAVAIATGMEYKEAYELVNKISAEVKLGKNHKGTSNARTGIHLKVFRKVMDHIGWKWVPTMQFGKGCTTHMRKDELPAGTVILNVSKHYAAMIDHVVHDLYIDDREGTRCVYGYWHKP